MSFIDPSEMKREELEAALITTSAENKFVLEHLSEEIQHTHNALTRQVTILKAVTLAQIGNQGMIDAYNKVTEQLIEQLCSLLISEKDIDNVNKHLENE